MPLSFFIFPFCPWYFCSHNLINSHVALQKNGAQYLWDETGGSDIQQLTGRLPQHSETEDNMTNPTPYATVQNGNVLIF